MRRWGISHAVISIFIKYIYHNTYYMNDTNTKIWASSTDGWRPISQSLLIAKLTYLYLAVYTYLFFRELGEHH